MRDSTVYSPQDIPQCMGSLVLTGRVAWDGILHLQTSPPIGEENHMIASSLSWYVNAYAVWVHACCYLKQDD